MTLDRVVGAGSGAGFKIWLRFLLLQLCLQPVEFCPAWPPVDENHYLFYLLGSTSKVRGLKLANTMVSVK